MIPEQVDKLIDFGQMALEQGWYDQARKNFDQALELDASNREAMKGLARVNEILSRRMPTAVEPTRAESLREVSFEPTKPEVEPAGPRVERGQQASFESQTSVPTVETRREQSRGVRYWIVRVVLVAVVLVVLVAVGIGTVIGLLTIWNPYTPPASVSAFTPTPMPTSTPAINEYCESLIQYQEAAISLEREWAAVFVKYSYHNSWELVGELREIHQRWVNSKPPDVDAAWSWYLKVGSGWLYQIEANMAMLDGQIVRADYLMQLGNDTVIEAGRFRDRVRAEVAKCK